MIMTGEPTLTTSKERMAPELIFSSEHVPQLSITDSKVKWPLHFAFSYVQPVSNDEHLEKCLCNQSTYHGKYE